MFFQQSFTVLSKAVVPLIAPAALPELGAPAAYVGVFVSITAVVQMFVNIGCGNFIRRFGGLRVSQIGLIMVLLGMLFGSVGVLWTFLLTAILVALGTGAGTPASSHVLSRYSPPHLMPLVFSAKQTSVPVGQAFSGVLMPIFVVYFGWQGSLLAIGAMCAVFALILQPLRAELDRDRIPTQRLSLGDMKATLLVVLRERGLRRLATVMFAFVGLQTAYTTYIVLFLTEKLDFSLAEASGGMFATAMTVAIPTRIIWGYVAGTRIGASVVLCFLAIAMAVGTALTGFYTKDWASWQLVAVSVLVTSTALGWQGVLLSEIARHAPPGQIGSATGGVLSFSSLGQVVLPLVFSGILAATHNYSLGFYVTAVPALLAGIMLFVGGVDGTGLKGRTPPPT